MPRADKRNAHLAGLLDGEGNIGVYRSRNSNGFWGYAVNVNVANSDRRLMKYLVKHFGGTFRQNPKGFTWEPNGGKERAKEILDLVLPHIVIKKQQAMLVQDFVGLGRAICPERREKFYIRTKMLNRTGVPRRSRLPRGTKENWAYLAGILDGEGHICITKRKQYNCDGICYNKYISVTNCDKSLMLHLKRCFGGNYRPCYRSAKKENHAPSFVWEIFGSRVQKKLLLSVLPYLVIKRQQAINLLKYINMNGRYNPSQREALFASTKSLNCRTPLND